MIPFINGENERRSGAEGAKKDDAAPRRITTDSSSGLPHWHGVDDYDTLLGEGGEGGEGTS